MDFLAHASLHAAPIALIAGLALVFACSGSAKLVGGPATSVGTGTGGGQSWRAYCLLAALCALLGGGWRVRDLLRRPGRPQQPLAPAVVYTPTWMPPIAAPYALNFSCAQADGSRGTCSPSFCSGATDLAAASTADACIGSMTLTTAVNPATYLASVRVATCTASTDARCSAAALAAQFSGQSSVYAAYCNAGYLVLVTSSYPGFEVNLDQVVTPPKGTNCRTRSASIGAMAMQTLRVTLTPTLLPTASLSNNVAWFSSAYNYITEKNTGTIIPLPEAGPVGFTIAGQDIYP